ncbi:MAG: Fe-S cluster assembly ATPase SufC [Puniceicoccales bacterium]|jgi:Fe-S cluster assembly ATP-binding protein|nr:Fe-S cluster assembly ATPase SufC [Puniceicoccales bacterium]
MDSGLCIQNLHLQVENQTVLENFSLDVPKGEIHALMGPNGVGKSSLFKAIAGHPNYHVLRGDIYFNGISLRNRKPDDIAQRGIFLAFQHPLEMEGLSVANFIRAALQSRQKAGEVFSSTDFYAQLYCCMDQLRIDHSFSSRSIHVGFSGGEKKRCEVLQMLMLRPRFALLDEIDSGLDVDILQLMAKEIHKFQEENKMGGLVITHSARFLRHLRPDRVHVLLDGQIVRSGQEEIIGQIEHSGYRSFALS